MSSNQENGGSPRDHEEDEEGFESLAQEARRGLQAGGPEVDLTAIHLYIAGRLSDADAEAVRDRIATWENWSRAYWETMAAIGDNGEPSAET
jgi:hypothetical protein